MNPKKTAHFRDQLRKLARELEHTVATGSDDVRMPTGGQADGGLSTAPMHLADVGTDESLHETNSVLLQNSHYLLGEVSEALRRLEDGTFGYCENCRTPIKEERLQAIPYARHCIACAEKLETGGRLNLNDGRPDVETETIAANEKLLGGRDLDGERGPVAFTDFEDDDAEDEVDIHASGTAGGGTALGGLAGTNVGHGDPRSSDLEKATGSGQFDVDDESGEPTMTPLAGSSGGAVGGTPTAKRASPRSRSEKLSRDQNQDRRQGNTRS